MMAPEHQRQAQNSIVLISILVGERLALLYVASIRRLAMSA